MKFIVKDTQPCWVTWTYEVEAENADAAAELYWDGDHSEAIDGPEIGDCLDWVPGMDLSIDPAN